MLQWINNTLVKAKPEMHKKTFLKPVIKDSEFCSTCHKVSIPYALNHYKDFLRGQNHYDTFLLSGVSGHGARSFYYPPVAKGKCVDCHMNLVALADFGARDFDGKGGREIHDHLFLGANTGLATFLGRPDVAEAHARFLKDAKVRVDLFALRDGGGDRRPAPRPDPARSARRSGRASPISSRSSSGRSAWAIRSARGRSIRTRSGSS